MIDHVQIAEAFEIYHKLDRATSTTVNRFPISIASLLASGYGIQGLPPFIIDFSKDTSCWENEPLDKLATSDTLLCAHKSQLQHSSYGVLADPQKLTNETKRLHGGSRMLYLIGEQKSGTTNVFSFLKEYDSIHRSRKGKEVHFFDYYHHINMTSLSRFIHHMSADNMNETALEYVLDATPDCKIFIS